MAHKRIGHVTWINYYNYGTFLQAYALQQIIKSLHYETEIINDKKFIKHSFRTVLGFLKQLIFRPVRKYQLIIRTWRFKKFIRRYLQIENNVKDLRRVNQSYDIFICGSDQIWSINLKNHFNGFYFLSWVNKPKIAYAPSLGATKSTKEYNDLIEPWIKDFKAISTREQTGSEIIKEILKTTEIPVVIDPTLLLSSEKWLKICRPLNNLHCKYVLLYLLSYNTKYCIYARNEAKRRNAKLISIYTGVNGMEKFADHTVFPGPDGFISYIKSADCIITDSFHGTIFSILFRRPFLTFQRFRHSDKNNQNSRLENLFNQLSITNNFYNEEDLNMEFPNTPNFEQIDKRIEELKQTSISFLTKALNLNEL